MPAHYRPRLGRRPAASFTKSLGVVLAGAALMATVGMGWVATQDMGELTAPGQTAKAGLAGALEKSGARQERLDSDLADSSGLPLARAGVEAASARVRFLPEEVILANGQSAPVHKAVTIDGELVVPESAAEVGWWDGSAYAGDPFGNTVLAGHVDDPNGRGFFGALLSTKEGDSIEISNGAESLLYEVTRIDEIDKDALASSTDAFSQRGEHQLVMITCSGDWQPDLHSYANNTVVFAEPVDPG